MTELSRLIPVNHAHDLHSDVVATPKECANIAKRLGLPAIGLLFCAWHLRVGSRGRITASGLLRANVTQVCVITLKPFEQVLDQTFDIMFVPAGQETDKINLESVDEIPYSGSNLELGEATVEQLALMLDSYPRSVGERETAFQSDEIEALVDPDQTSKNRLN